MTLAGTASSFLPRLGSIAPVQKASRQVPDAMAARMLTRTSLSSLVHGLSPEFKLYLIKEFQRLKEDENRRLSLAWNLNRTLSKLNYHIHTDAIKDQLIPPEISPGQAAITYASEADVLNMALFGLTAKQWRDANPKLEGNMREYATVEQLLVLANIEGMNAEFIRMNLPQGERLKRLNQIAIRQMGTLTAHEAMRRLGPPKKGKE
jgi:hypothetical protein